MPPDWTFADMASPPADTLRPDIVGRLLYRLSVIVALLGGVVLTAVTVMTVYSIVGRHLVSFTWFRDLPVIGQFRPVTGDFELVELGCAVAIFAFLPYCQMVRGNVAVDFFTANAHPRTKAWLACLGNGLFTLIAGLLTWRLYHGYLDMERYGQTSMVLRIPIYWAYMPAVATMALLTVVCAYTVYRSLREALGEGEPSVGDVPS